jgi:hypothetical protein
MTRTTRAVATLHAAPGALEELSPTANPFRFGRGAKALHQGGVGQDFDRRPVPLTRLQATTRLLTLFLFIRLFFTRCLVSFSHSLCTATIVALFSLLRLFSRLFTLCTPILYNKAILRANRCAFATHLQPLPPFFNRKHPFDSIFVCAIESATPSLPLRPVYKTLPSKKGGQNPPPNFDGY